LTGYRIQGSTKAETPIRLIDLHMYAYQAPASAPQPCVRFVGRATGADFSRRLGEPISRGNAARISKLAKGETDRD
jgi:hypothetical protein